MWAWTTALVTTSLVSSRLAEPDRPSPRRRRSSLAVLPRPGGIRFPYGGEIGLRREPLRVDFASSVVAVVSGGHHRPADTSRVVDEQLVGGEASEAESGRSATVDFPRPTGR